MNDTFYTIKLEKHETKNIEDKHVNGSLTVIWRDWDNIIKNHPKMIYVTSVNPDCNVTILELAKKISSLFPEKKLKVIFDKQSIDDEYIKSKIYLQNPDITKITKLGWTPKFSIEMGFTRTIMSYIKND